jgi:hypothetical protein
VRRLRVAPDKGATFFLALGTQNEDSFGVQRPGAHSELKKVWVLNQ